MRKFLLTLLCLILISCSSGTTEESVSETQAEETTTTESTTTTSTTTTTVYEEPPFAIDEFGLEIQEPPIEIKEQLAELMKFIERRIGLEFIEEPLYDFYTLNNYRYLQRDLVTRIKCSKKNSQDFTMRSVLK